MSLSCNSKFHDIGELGRHGVQEVTLYTGGNIRISACDIVPAHYECQDYALV